MAHQEVEYLVLRYNAYSKLFSCQQIYTPNFGEISEYISYPMIYKEGGKIHNQEIPQAELLMKIKTDYGSIFVSFVESNSNVFHKETIRGVSFNAQGKVAAYIADTLNDRISQLLKENNEISNLGIIGKYRKINEDLRDENQILKDQLKEMEKLKRQNQKLISELTELNNKWYFKFAMLLQKKSSVLHN